MPRRKKAPAEEEGGSSTQFFDATFMGSFDIPEGMEPGLEAVGYAMPHLKRQAKSIGTKISLAISAVSGIKAGAARRQRPRTPPTPRRRPCAHSLRA